MQLNTSLLSQQVTNPETSNTKVLLHTASAERTRIPDSRTESTYMYHELRTCPTTQESMLSPESAHRITVQQQFNLIFIFTSFTLTFVYIFI